MPDAGFHFSSANNKWVSEEVQLYSVFRHPVEKYLAEMNRLARTMFAIIAAGMPYGPHVFDEFLDGTPIALLSPKHYPPSKSHEFHEDEDRSKAMGCGPHTDFGALTLLLQDMLGGLQVQHGDDWIDVTPDRDLYVVNIGDMLQTWTKGEYKSTVHRVLSPGGDKHRYSLPFFFNGNELARLAPLEELARGETERSENNVKTVGNHLMERVMATFLKERGGISALENSA